MRVFIWQALFVVQVCVSYMIEGVCCLSCLDS